MSELKATPGPWEWVPDRFRGGFSGIVGPHNQEVLVANSANDGDTGAAWFEDFPNEHDRHLIASAPDLYEALVVARLHVASDVEADETSEDGPSTYAHLNKARLVQIDAALARARGQS